MPRAARFSNTARGLKLSKVHSSASWAFASAPSLSHASTTVCVAARSASLEATGKYPLRLITTGRGEESANPGKRQSRLGSSVSSVPRPVTIASCVARNMWPILRDNAPVIQGGSPSGVRIKPFLLTPSFSVTCGSPPLMRDKKPALTSYATSRINPSCTLIPAWRNFSAPRPATRGSGSRSAKKTDLSSAFTNASAQGAVLPVCEHGSSVT